MSSQSIVCASCNEPVPYGRLSCPSCGALLASVEYEVRREGHQRYPGPPACRRQIDGPRHVDAAARVGLTLGIVHADVSCGVDHGPGCMATEHSGHTGWIGDVHVVAADELRR